MSRWRSHAGALGLALQVAIGGCAGQGDPAPPPAPEQASTVGDRWSAAGTQALALAESGRYAEADSVLAAFATRHLGTPEGADALYWRALLRLDPANPAAAPRDAVVAIDAYLAGGAAQPRYEELLLLRRLAGNLERVRLLAIEAERARAEPPADTLGAVVARQAEELARLRTELERTQAELERLRRRIRPEPPPRAP